MLTRLEVREGQLLSAVSSKASQRPEEGEPTQCPSDLPLELAQMGQENPALLGADTAEDKYILKCN